MYPRKPLTLDELIAQLKRLKKAAPTKGDTPCFITWINHSPIPLTHVVFEPDLDTGALMLVLDSAD